MLFIDLFVMIYIFYSIGGVGYVDMLVKSYL